jgi:hypothetical protein
MSLNLLLPPSGVDDLVTEWPDDPRVYARGDTELDRVITPSLLRDYVDTGCVPAPEVAVMKQGPELHPGSFMTNGRTDPAKLDKLYRAGYTIRLGNLQRVMPFMAHLTRAIQQETGYSNYVHAFLTPPESQGLLHHWDQQMAVIAQVSGTKRWELWRPVVESPMRAHLESFRVWKNSYMRDWTTAGPDMVIDLKPGESLLLPRGWVHNPFNVDPDEASVHLTFAIRERTPFWLAEHLVATAIERLDFRQIILSGDLNGDALPDIVRDTRRALMAHLEALDADKFAKLLQQLAATELEYTT